MWYYSQGNERIEVTAKQLLSLAKNGEFVPDKGYRGHDYQGSAVVRISKNAAMECDEKLGIYDRTAFSDSTI